MKSDTLEKFFERSGRKIKPDMNVYHDTSAFMDLDAGDVMILEDRPYLISRNEKEVGFGMDDDPKYWVKRTTSLEDGSTKIVKLVFFEEFWQKIGGHNVRFFRSPEKEAEILETISGHPFYMQGTWTKDAADNNVRIIDFIRGPSIRGMINLTDCSHEIYFQRELPAILTKLLECLEALAYLHEHNLVHGDVRWDHILWDRAHKRFRWIDFDYAYNFPENPFGADLLGIGKILVNVIGQGHRFYTDLKYDRAFKERIKDLVQEDFSIVEHNRLMNLKKIFPYLPDSLNNILLHFSGHAAVFYESVEEVADDLRYALKNAF